MILTEPINAGGLLLKNRLVFPAFETNWATAEGHVTPELIHLWKLLAQGGCGLIIVQATSVNPDMEHRHTPFVTCLHDDRYIDDYRKAVAEVKAAVPDVKMAIQLVDKTLLGRHLTPKAMDIEEIKSSIAYHAQAARRAMQAGFDAVEVHAAHCYMLADFLSRRGNDRPHWDPYGRTKEGRLRIQREVIGQIRELGVDIPIIYRFSGDEFIVGGNTVQDGIHTAQTMEAAGVNILDISAGGRRDEGPDSYSPTRSVPRAYHEDACNVHIAERIKKYVSIPVITAGKIGTISLANQILEEGRADLVAMARQLFCDPCTLKKTLEDREEEIVRCTWCRKCHISYLANEKALCRQKAWQQDYMPASFKN